MRSRQQELRGEATTLREERASLDADIEDIAQKVATLETVGEGSESGQHIAKRLRTRAAALDAQKTRIENRLDVIERELGGDNGGNADDEKRSRILGGGEFVGVDGSRGGKPARGSDIRGRALDINERANTVPDAAREKVARTIENDADPDSKLARYVIATGNADYASAFRKWLRDPLSGHYEWTPQEREAYAFAQAEARAMSLTGAAGGFLVSYELDPQILIANAGSINPIREIARTEIVSQNVNKFVTSLGVTASWDAEGAEVSDDTPTLVQPSITCFKGQAFVPVSFEVFEDSPDLGAQIQKLFLDAKLQLEATAFTTGTGTGEPKGVITAVAAVGGSVVTAAGGAIAIADIYANQAALPPRWRPNAQWMANLSIINGARQLIAGTGLTTSIVDDSTTPPKMLGWTLRENSQMDGTIAGGTTNDYVLLSGDFNQYIVADRIGTTVEFVQNLFGASQRPTGQRGFLLHWRTGADVVIPDAFRLTNYSA